MSACEEVERPERVVSRQWSTAASAKRRHLMSHARCGSEDGIVWTVGALISTAAWILA